MKFLPTLLVLLSSLAFAQENAKTRNIILVTWDGFRWQELFTGAESRLIKDRYVNSPEDLKNVFWSDDLKERREKLTPFIWKTIAKEGVIIGNRNLGCNMEVTNTHNFSYPGYNEIFTGYGDRKVNSNDYPDNPNYTIFDCLQANDGFKNQVAAFATWDAFPRIINTKRNGTPVYIDFKTENGATTSIDMTINNWETSAPLSNNHFAKTDTMTYHFSKEYLKANHPRVAFIGFDETDGFAHEGRYDAYLNTAYMLDSYLQDLWTFIQSDEFYRDNTTLIITCDHGRGVTGSLWRHHARVLPRSKQTWMAAIGSGIKNDGELTSGTYYTKQIAATISQLLGVHFSDDEKVGKPMEAILK